MRKIRLSDTDLELFDIEISPSEYTFYQRHKDAFRTMWKEQGKPFWMRFVITFRSFTVKHGVIKQMNIDSPKFENLIDQAFIFIHEQFVDGKEKTAKNFLEDVARLAQNQDKFPALDSKSFARDPFYLRETRELFRSFFGMPDQKSSYLKVYILCPVFMRFGGSICRCLERWLLAPNQDPNDDSYWVPPQRHIQEKSDHKNCIHEIVMCEKCIEDCGERYFKEKILGNPVQPIFIDSWKLGDPRFNDCDNPLFAPHVEPFSDWRDCVTAEAFREFVYYSKNAYGNEEDKCSACTELRHHKEKVLQLRATECRKKTKTGDQREVDLTQLEEFRDLKSRLQALDIDDFKEVDFEHCTEDIALDLSEKLINLAKDKYPEEKREVFGIDKKEEELRKLQQIKKKEKQERKRQRRKANKAQAAAEKKESMAKSASQSSLPSQEKKPQSFSDVDDDDDDPIEPIKIERDEKKGIISVIVTKNDRTKKNGLQNGSVKTKGLPDGVALTIDLIRAQIEGLPRLFEFWEGTSYRIAVLNYEEEEKEECEKPTNFTIKVSGVHNKLLENIIVKLLFYVQKRKNRKCPGWNMDSDDVLVCIQPDEDRDLAGLEVNIYRGAFFKAKLSKKERTSLKQSIPHRKILMMLAPEKAKEIRESEDGKERFWSIISQVCKHDSRKEKMLRCNALWDQLLNNPSKFDFVLTVNSARVEELRKIGLRPLDIGYDEFMDMQNPSINLCRNCCKMKYNCECEHKMDTLQFEPDPSGNCMRLVNTGEQYKIIGGNIVEGPNNETQLHLTEISKEMLQGNIIQLQGATLPEDGSPLISRNPLREPPTLDYKIVPEGMSGNINVSFSKVANEQCMSVKLEAVMPEEDYEKTEEMLQQMKEDFENDLTPDQAKLVKSIEIQRTRTSEPHNCEKHQPASQKSSPSANQSSSPSASQKSSSKPVSPSTNKKSPSKAVPPSDTQKTSMGLADKFLATKHEFKSTGACSHRSANGKGSFKKTCGKPDPLANLDTQTSEFLKAVSKEFIPEDLCTKITPEDIENLNIRVKKSHEPGPTIRIELGDRLLNGPDERAKKTDWGSKKETQSPKQETKLTNGKNRESNGKVDSGKCTDDKQALKICGSCGKKEPKRKAFKKCQKCKDEGVKNVRYYCGRDCQIEDWKNKHKAEHSNNSLV